MIVATVVIAVAVVGVAVWIRGGLISAAAEPSWLEKKVARQLPNFSMPQAARVQTNPGKATPENLQQAQEIFLARGSVCQGHDGSGVTQVGRGLYPKPPDLRLGRRRMIGSFRRLECLRELWKKSGA